uniref:Uncharacterized protein n=1 Tax=Caulobacter phage BL57 TaxID=3348355 RepID=A0AB74UMN5_9VIRU
MTAPYTLIKELPANKAWNLHVFTDQDGHVRVRTGWYGNDWRREVDYREVNNRIIATALKIGGYGRGRSSVTFTLKDRGGFAYHAGGKTTMLLLGALAAGVINVDQDGYFAGHWTFAKQGQEVYITPADPATGKAFRLPEGDDED